MFKIEKVPTKNFTKGNNKKNEYIVLHYYGALGTAKAVANYFATTLRQASAQYSLDEGEIIYQSVEDHDIAWHCGTSGKYKHPKCRNSNSIGIEIRPHKLSAATKFASDKDWYFKPEVEAKVEDFVRYLMAKYKIPASNVLRHYDVTGKQCPRPYQGTDINTYYKNSGNAMWELFKKKLVAPAVIKVGDLVQFKGGNVYVSSTARSAASTRPSSICKVTVLAKGTHPYHCISEDGKGVYGWVNASSVVLLPKTATGGYVPAPPPPEPPKPTPIKVGDIVQFEGGNVYRSSVSTAIAARRPSSKCRVSIVANTPRLNPYHCISIDGKGVYGWVRTVKKI